MIASTKKFSKSDHSLSDPLSRLYAADFLSQIDPHFQLRVPLIEQKEEYKKWDFTIFYDDTPVTIETEQKRVWTSSDGSFPYSTIDVPTRKWQSQANLYIMFNLGFDALAMTEMPKILAAEVTTKSTRRGSGEYLTQGETFFRVPTNIFRFYKLSGIWTKI